MFLPIRKRLCTVDLKVFLVLLTVSVVLFYPEMQNDCFWLIKIGEHIFNNGFPLSEPLTYHIGLYYPVQQWLSSVIFFIVHKFTGFTGLFILTLLMYILISISIYNFSRLIGEGNRTIALSCAIMSIAFLTLFVVPRPQIFSYIIFILELTMLEKFLKTLDYKYLMAMPLLSVLLINLHAALWVFFIILIIPYFFDGFKRLASALKTEGHSSNRHIFLTMISCMAAGLINPYGLDNMLYSVRSFGCGYDAIAEMLSPGFKGPLGIIYIVYFLLIFFIYRYKNSTTTIRFALITFGTTYMALLSVRNLALAAICSVPLFSYYLKGMPDTLDSDAKCKLIFSRTSFIIALLIIMVKVSSIMFNPALIFIDEDIMPVKAADYLIENADTDKMKLYNDYNIGGYLEFRGIKTFIDSRAEVFTKKINRKADILKDEIDLSGLNVYYKDVFAKYGFTHWLVYKKGNLNTYMERDSDYEKIYEDKTYVIYKIAE